MIAAIPNVLTKGGGTVNRLLRTTDGGDLDNALGQPAHWWRGNALRWELGDALTSRLREERPSLLDGWLVQFLQTWCPRRVPYLPHPTVSVSLFLSPTSSALQRLTPIPPHFLKLLTGFVITSLRFFPSASSLLSLTRSQ